MRTSRVQYRHGFTLIEVMIAVAIIAILAAVAYPAYQDQILRARRAEGKAALLKAAQLQERNYVNGNPVTGDGVPTYLDSAGLALLFGLPAPGAGLPAPTIYSGEDPSGGPPANFNPGWYVIAVDLPAGACALPDCFVVRATPNNAAPRNFDDRKPRGSGPLQCGELTLDNAGRRGVQTGAALTVAECWDR